MRCSAIQPAGYWGAPASAHRLDKINIFRYVIWFFLSERLRYISKALVLYFCFLASQCIYMSFDLYIHIINIYIYIYIYIYTYIFIFIYLYIHIYLHTYIYVYINIHDIQYNIQYKEPFACKYVTLLQSFHRGKLS